MPLMIKQSASGTGSHEPASGESSTVHRIYMYQEGCVIFNAFLSGKSLNKLSYYIIIIISTLEFESLDLNWAIGHQQSFSIPISPLQAARLAPS